jgi:hypothetical protein
MGLLDAAYYILAPMLILATGLGIATGLVVRAFSMHTLQGWRRGPELDVSVAGIGSLVGAVASVGGTVFAFFTLLPSWELQGAGVLSFGFLALIVYTFGGFGTGPPKRH